MRLLCSLNKSLVFLPLSDVIILIELEASPLQGRILEYPN